MTANVNVTKVLFKRGNTAQNAAYTGINGEITVDTQAKTLRVHDGVTTGGNIVTAGAMASYIPTDPTITSIQANITAANAAISAITGIDTSLLANAATQQTQINLINANVAAANAAITNLQSNAGTQATGIDTVNANIGAYQTYANATFGTSNYGNANVAAYLSAFDGNILPGANVTYSLGSEQFQWRDLWVSNNTIYIGNTPIRVDGGTLLVNGAPVGGGATGDITFTNTTMSPPNGEDIIISAANSQVDIQALDFRVVTTDDVRITGNDVVSLRNLSATEPVSIFTDYNGSAYGWEFGADGVLSAPGDIVVSGDVTGTVGASTLNLLAQPGSNTYIQLNNTVDSYIRAAANLTISTANTDHTWTFDRFGNLVLPNLGNINYANGTSILSGISGGTTGNISVGDGRINFVASSSGDGNGFSTIEIRPDDVYTSGQNYLIIDPTAPNHIHIRAGGEQDNSQAELYLGGENSYFMVDNGTNPEVRISANTYVWYYGTDGNVTFPSSGSIIFDSSATSVIDGISSIVFADATTQTTAWTGTVNFGNTIAIGYNTGTVSQGGGAVAIGSIAGNVSQGVGAVAVGEAAGRLSQGAEGIAIGKTAGEQSQGAYAIAIGSATAYYQQGLGAVAIGTSAGALQQGNHAIAIGTGAGNALQGNNSIILNASGGPLDQSTDNTFTVAPIRNTGGTHGVLQYNNSTKEVSYSSTLVGNLSVTGNITQQSAYYETYANVTNSGGNLTCNFVNGATFYATLTANVTVNFTNVVATAGRVTGATLIVDQGATPYSVANIQINSGSVQTVKWAGGTTNTGTASNTDIMSFSLISLDGTNWRILGQIANYA